MEKHACIYVAGHRGLAGSAILRKLQDEGYTNLVYRTSSELDLRNRTDVDAFFQSSSIDYVFLAAAKVGGITANNDYPADFIRDNLYIQTNVIDAAYTHSVKKLLFLGSTCIYPKHAPQPIREEALLTGALEPTNEPYAIAKIAGLKMCESYNRQYGTRFIAAMPTNLYGKHDNFDLETSHVLPALMRKCHEAKVNGDPAVEIWGTGEPRREFMYADDLADACVFLMNEYDGTDMVNVGTGRDLSIRELAEALKDVTGFEGEFVFNTSKPDGTFRKRTDVTRLNSLGWQAQTPLADGLQKTYDWYTGHAAQPNKGAASL
ncbi:GDP-L-fucose synthase family protein [Marinococcus halophilus]|uniref:GDP-L-fucose synthase family protein n=1 Tax=Marinococcus halophilus TaxID=1371 RepID=UPI0009A80224|nr:GDP-L-fucose synthase [Marinococcus halophilus]